MRNFSDLTEREILALAIANEEEDGRIYLDIAEGLRADYPGSANVFTEMAAEEGEHRRRLLDVYREKFGEHIPLIRRQDVRGFIQHKPVWQMYPMNLKAVRNLAESMETETQGFYRRAAARSEDVTIRKLLGDLADAEVEHERRADQLVGRKPARQCPPCRRRTRPPVFRVAGDPARPGRPDGRVRLHPGTGIRRGLCLQQHLGNLPGRSRRVRRRRHFYGFRRGTVRQRQPDRPGRPADPRRHLRA